MPDAFDPYHTWLGIQPSEQPPDYYRLLGLPRFEEKPEAIEHAADLRMAHLGTLGTGKHAQWSQKLLGEVAAARVCLLNPEKKAAYERLRTQFSSRFAAVANQCREKLIELYGEEKGRQVRYAEAFEICEYGRQPTAEELRTLFPLEN